MKASGFTVLGLRALSDLDLRERLVLNLLGIKHKYVTGYRGTSKARVAMLQGEGDYLTESQPAFRAKVIPTPIKPGQAFGLYYYSLDDYENLYAPASFGKGLDMLPFHKFYEKVKEKKPSGETWNIFREVNRAAAMAQRSIIMSPESPKASRNALRDAVLKLNKDPGFRADALKSVNFVPFYDVGSAAENILAASAKLSPSTVEFLTDYIAKVEKKKK